MDFDRAGALRRLADEDFDVLVVGGGITGVGVALDAATRGLRTGLVERHDFASGTSSKSSKLVHGGLRYLQQREFRLVYEALAERQRLRNTAPHLVRLLPFLIPLFGSGGAINPKLARAVRWALWMYDFTGGARIGKLHERVTAEEALAHLPILDPAKVVGGFVYYDAQTDDARLTLAVARTAAEHGAAVANYAVLRGIERDDAGRVRAAVVEADGERFEVRTRLVVNAGGVWADEIRALDEGRNPASIRPAKGVHLAVPWEKVRNDIAVVVPVRGDRRSVFVIPQGPHTYIGTTDTDYDGPLDDPHCTTEDVEYLLGALNGWVTEKLTPGDVVGTWAGLRPLVRGETDDRTADLSRNHQVQRSPSGVITVTGGKLTTYRRMAADTVDEAVRALGRGGRCRTRALALHGADGTHELRQPGAADRLGLDGDLLEHLVGRYGGQARALAAMLAADPDLGRRVVPSLPHVWAEARYAARYEMARTLDDILTRRLPARWLAAEEAAAAAPDIAALVGPDLGWDGAEQARQVDAFRRLVAADRTAAGLATSAGAGMPS